MMSLRSAMARDSVAQLCSSMPTAIGFCRTSSGPKETPRTARYIVEKSPLQCAGMNRLEVEDERALRERSSDPLGLESCAVTARDTAKRRHEAVKCSEPLH